MLQEDLLEAVPPLTACSTGTAAGDTSPSLTEASPATSPHALQLHVGHVPFWGLPPTASPAAASIDADALPGGGTPTTAVGGSAPAVIPEMLSETRKPSTTRAAGQSQDVRPSMSLNAPVMFRPNH